MISNVGLSREKVMGEVADGSFLAKEILREVSVYDADRGHRIWVLSLVAILSLKSRPAISEIPIVLKYPGRNDVVRGSLRLRRLLI